jgi:purine-nucleoside phosphorylase
VRIAADSLYENLPGFQAVSVRGHAGRLVLGHLGKTPVLVLSGRLHYYEGHSMEAVTFPIRLLAEFGIRDLLLTNAAGAINRRFHPGEFMLVSDHINFMAANPLRGACADADRRFVDLTRTYDRRLNRLLAAAAKRIKLRLRTGVYLAVAGPCYETPAEIRAFARLGADAVGMSTVPEAIVARQCGVAVAAVSCLTNLAAGRGKKALCHEEVLAAGKQAGETAAELLQEFAELYAENRLY